MRKRIISLVFIVAVAVAACTSLGGASSAGCNCGAHTSSPLSIVK